MITQYRYKLPAINPGADTRSFGIKPYNVETGRKSGTAIVRLVIFNWIHTSAAEAMAAADRITERLNAGGTYAGTRTLRFDWRHQHTPESVEGYF